jgi:hypothetical protein
VPVLKKEFNNQYKAWNKYLNIGRALDIFDTIISIKSMEQQL